jgi:hypothetical protein
MESKYKYSRRHLITIIITRFIVSNIFLISPLWISSYVYEGMPWWGWLLMIIGFRIFARTVYYTEILGAMDKKKKAK